MNLPITLTISRFFLIPVFVVTYFRGYEKTAFLVFILAGLTDIADGYLARKYNQVSKLGSLLDPLADKLMVLTVFFTLLVAKKISWIFVVIVLIRDGGMIISSIIFHFKGKKTVPANRLGKLTTVLFYIAIMLVSFDLPYHSEFLWLVIIFSLITSIVYLLEFKKANKIEIESDEYTKGATMASK